ncbi:MAG TPA: TetR/AcrR family transcriptional regulator [Polyangiaceae bacterium]|nr:TetR/AcrR family transcriptional regulator [Polyangiaceae bacterium]
MVSVEPFFVREDDPPAKREILKAALSAFVRDGVASTSIRTIAAESGYTNPALFKHFAGKDELALYLFERCFEQLSRHVERALRGERPFRHKVHTLLDEFASFLDQDLEAFLYVQEELRRLWPKVSPAIRRRSIVRMLRVLLEQGRLEGSVAREQSLELQLHAFLGMVAQLGRALYFGELPSSARDVLPEFEVLCLKMLTR